MEAFCFLKWKSLNSSILFPAVSPLFYFFPEVYLALHYFWKYTPLTGDHTCLLSRTAAGRRWTSGGCAPRRRSPSFSSSSLGKWILSSSTNHNFRNNNNDIIFYKKKHFQNFKFCFLLLFLMMYAQEVVTQFKVIST